MVSKLDRLEKIIQKHSYSFSRSKTMSALVETLDLIKPIFLSMSILLIVYTFPSTLWQNFLQRNINQQVIWNIITLGMSLVSILMAFSTSYYYAKNIDIENIKPAVISTFSFIIIALVNQDSMSEISSIESIGINHIYTALIVALITTTVYKILHDAIKRMRIPKSIPPTAINYIVESCYGAIIIFLWLLTIRFLHICGLISVQNTVNTILIGPMKIISILNSLFWFFGSHGTKNISIIFLPLWFMNLAENITLLNNHERLTNIITPSFFETFVYIGGSGATIGLVILIYLFSKKRNISTRLKDMKSLTSVPGMFNINESIMFALPIVGNFSLFIPFVLVPVFNTIIAYTAMKFGLVPLTYAVTTWTMPPLISGLVTTGSIRGSILQVILIVLDTMIYLPFFIRIINKNYIVRSKDDEKTNQFK